MAGAHGASARSCHPRPRGGPAALGEYRVPSPDQKSFHISTTPTTRGRKRRPPRSITPSTVWKSQPHWLIADRLELMEPARCESCPSGQCRGPAASGEDNVPSPDLKSFYISETPTTAGRKLSSHGSIPPRTVWKFQLRWLIADWLELLESAHGESFSSGRRRGPVAPGENRFPPSNHNSFLISTSPTTGRRKRRSPGSIPPRTAWKPQPHGLVADWLGLMEPARGVAVLDHVEVPPP